jgi:hypothetical protein
MLWSFGETSLTTRSPIRNSPSETVSSQTILPLSKLGSLLPTLMGPVATTPLFAGATAGGDRALQVKIARLT